MPENFIISPETPKGQRDAIITDEKIITVGAGAGTGKTWVLSGRYARLIVNDDILLPRDILTLTYTEAAADEMKLRIEDKLKDSAKSIANLERKREIIDGLAESWISTIHSFAARLIRESGLSLDIDPGASVITPQQEQDFWDNIRNALEFANLRQLSRAYGDKSLQKICDSLDHDNLLSSAVNKWKSDSLSILAQNTAELQASLGNSWEDMLNWADNDELQDKAKSLVKNLMLNEWREIWNLFADMNLPKAKSTNQSGQLLNNLLEWQRVNNPDDINLQNFYRAIFNIKANTGEPFKTLKTYTDNLSLGEWKKTRPAIIVNLTDNFSENFSDYEKALRKSLLLFCAVSWAMWDRMKKQRGLLSFSDMILHAKRAITEGGVSRKFSHVLVDEFQDTDPLQFQMIESLARDYSSLFAVGDPKQSIYKFRHAEPALFADTIQRADAKINLDVNFRTRSSLINRINNLFAEIWQHGLGSSDSMAKLKYESLNPANIDDLRDSGTMPDFKILLATHGRSSQDAKKILADNLAKNIAEWVKEGRTIWDKAGKIIRPVKFSDFAILSRSRGIYDILEESLNKFNIPSIQDKSSDFFSRGEINDVICMLRAAADFHDDFSVMGWLMSPFSRLSQNKAIKIFSQINKEFRPIDAVKKDYPEIYSRLEYLAIVGEHEGPAGLLEIYDINRDWLSCYNESDRLRILRNFHRAVKIARDFQKSGTAGLIACADWLLKAVRRESGGIEEPSWHDRDENAVRLSTVHSSKGLEYPVTVIFEARTSNKHKNEAIRASKELGLVFSSYPDELNAGDSKPQGAEWDSLLSEQGDSEEETRLFYVAMTRAQDSQIFCGLVNQEGKANNNTWTKILLDHDNATPEYVQEISDYKSLKINNEDSGKILTPLKLIHSQNYLRQISASSFALFEFCPFAWRRKYRQGINLTWESPDRDSIFDDDLNFSGGADSGSLAHWILERWPRSEDYSEKLENLLSDRSVLSSLPGYLRGAWRNKEIRENLKKWLSDFADSQLGQKLINNSGIKREQDFRIRLNNNTALAGSIDAYYKDSQNLYHVIDYKITLSRKAPPGLYDSQLDFYALAVNELTHCGKINVILAFLRENNFAERIITDFDSIRERVINASKNCASCSYEPNTKNCASCPFKKGCIYHE